MYAFAIIAVIVFLIIVPLSIIFNKGNEEITENKKEVVPIYSLETGTTINGAFIFGTGVVNGTVKYYVYVPKDNGHILKEYEASETIIAEENGTPRCEEYYKIRKVKDTMFSLNLLADKKENGYSEYWDLQKRVLYLPKNTIKQTFNTTINK